MYVIFQIILEMIFVLHSHLSIVNHSLPLVSPPPHRRKIVILQTQYLCSFDVFFLQSHNLCNFCATSAQPVLNFLHRQMSFNKLKFHSVKYLTNNLWTSLIICFMTKHCYTDTSFIVFVYFLLKVNTKLVWISQNLPTILAKFLS